MASQRRSPPSVWATWRASENGKRKQQYEQYNTGTSVKLALSHDPQISTIDLNRRRLAPRLANGIEVGTWADAIRQLEAVS
jgi:hypothetical protein